MRASVIPAWGRVRSYAGALGLQYVRNGHTMYKGRCSIFREVGWLQAVLHCCPEVSTLHLQSCRPQYATGHASFFNSSTALAMQVFNSTKCLRPHHAIAHPPLVVKNTRHCRSRQPY